MVDHPDEVAQGEPPVSDHALDLVELRKVGRVQRLVPEHPVDGEVFLRSELLLLCELVQHPCRHGCGVSPQQVLGRLVQLPVVAVALGSVAAAAVHLPHPLQVLAGEVLRGGGIRDEECVVSIPGWVLLRLKM